MTNPRTIEILTLLHVPLPPPHDPPLTVPVPPVHIDVQVKTAAHLLIGIQLPTLELDLGVGLLLLQDRQLLLKERRVPPEGGVDVLLLVHELVHPDY